MNMLTILQESAFSTWQGIAIYFVSMVGFFVTWALYLQDFWKMIFPSNPILHVISTGSIDIVISLGVAVVASWIKIGLFGKQQKNGDVTR